MITTLDIKQLERFFAKLDQKKGGGGGGYFGVILYWTRFLESDVGLNLLLG